VQWPVEYRDYWFGPRGLAELPLQLSGPLRMFSEMNVFSWEGVD
jgi:hypothetical protein